MEIEVRENQYIFTPLSPVLDNRECERLFKEIEVSDCSSIGFDMNYVKSCTKEFFFGLKELSKKYQVSMFNICSDVFVLINIMHFDKEINLYTSELDFSEKARQLLNRKFLVV